MGVCKKWKWKGRLGKMNYRKILFALGASALLLAACSDEKKTPEVKAEVKDKAEEVETEEMDTTSEVDDALAELRAALEDLEPKDETDIGNDSEILNPNIAEMTEGDVKVLYTNKEPGYAHDMDGFIVTIDEYQLTKVSDVNRDSEYLFKGAQEGYVMTALATYENKRSNPVYYAGFASLLMDDRFDLVYGDKFKLVPREDVLKSDDPASVNKYPPGFKKQGFLSFVMTNDQYDKLETTNPKLIIDGGASEREDMKEAFREEAVFDFKYSGDSEEAIATGPAFYRDDLTNQNIADKTMIFEKTGIGQKLELDGVEVTLEGVQYTEIEPTEEYKSTFRNFAEDGIVALTIKLNVDNNSEETIRLDGIGSILSVDDNEFRYLYQGSLEPDTLKTLEPGESGEKLHVFLFDKYQFDRHEKFELIFGPFSAEDGKKLFKERDLVFKLPR
jgi:outer membrane murein-binding lipoprotein Lpp